MTSAMFVNLFLKWIAKIWKTFIPSIVCSTTTRPRPFTLHRLSWCRSDMSFRVGFFAMVLAQMAFGTNATSTGVSAVGSSPNCWDAAHGYYVRDPEFDSVTGLAAVQFDPVLAPDGTVLQDGSIFLAPVDPATGTLDLILYTRYPVPSHLR